MKVTLSVKEQITLIAALRYAGNQWLLTNQNDYLELYNKIKPVCTITDADGEEWFPQELMLEAAL